MISATPDNVSATPSQSASTRVVFLQDELTIVPAFKVLFGGRLDHNKDFGSHFSPKGAVHAELGPNVDLRASVGRGFRAPSLTDLNRTFINFAHGYQVLGNNNLNPETSTNINVGVVATLNNVLQARINFFRNDLEDAIRAEQIGVDGRLLSFTYRNVERAKTQGVETEFQARLSRSFTMRASYAYVKAEDEETGDDLLGVSPHTADWKLEYRNRRWDLEANVRGDT